ncbi:MAG: hypothetical protein H6719_05015 [Sandaracinaceae bacterium]|nr:hypothetical protein [Sandaracinaceae bacterium]
MRERRLCFIGLTLLLGSGCDLFDSGSEDGGAHGRGINDVCMATTECRAGLICDSSGTCQPAQDVPEGGVCALTGDCMDGLFCGPNRTCVPSGTGTDGTDCGSTSECERGLICALEGFGFRCRAAGAGDIGDGCVSETDCIAGLACLQSESGSRCLNPPTFHGDGGINGMLPPALPDWQGVTCQEDTGPPTAYFHVRRGDDTDRDFYRLPFPNDVLRSASGIDLTGHPTPSTAVSVDVLGRHIAAIEADVDGFATNPVIYFRFSKPYEWADISADSVMLVDVTPGSPEYGANVGRSWLTTYGQITRYLCPDWLSVRRGHGQPLRPGTTYAAILTSGIRTHAEEGNEPFGRAADLDALLSDTAPSGAPLASAWTAYQPLRDWLAMADTIGPDDVLNAAVFTTQDPAAMVPALRRAVRAQPAPTITDVTVCDTGVTSPCDDGGRRVCGAANDAFWEVHARISLPQFQTGTAPYEEPSDGGAIETDAAGTPLVQGTDDVCMVMTIPKGVPAPPTGYPVVFYGHGTGGAFTAPVSNGLAAQFATENGGSGAPHAVTVAIDMPLHGSRANGSTRTPDTLVYNFLNPAAARDNFMQGAADFMSLVYWAETYTLAAASSPTSADVTFDPARMVVFGHSQGASHEMLIIPFEPGVRGWLISGGGGDLTQSLLTKTNPVNISAAVPLALLDPDASGRLVAGDQHPALALIQMYFERVDPVNFGRYTYREPVDMAGHHVFMTYGVGDTFTTEATMQAYAQSASMPHLMPVIVDASLGDPIPAPAIGNVAVNMLPYSVGMRQYMPDAGDDGHFVSTQTTQGRADAVRFVLEAAAGAVPPIGN